MGGMENSFDWSNDSLNFLAGPMKHKDRKKQLHLRTNKATNDSSNNNKTIFFKTFEILAAEL